MSTACDDAHGSSFNYVMYQKENQFKTAVPCTLQFGIIQSCAPTEANRQKLIPTLGTKNWVVAVPGPYEPTIPVNYVVTDARDMEFAWGVITYGGIGDTTSTFVEPTEDTRVIAGCDITEGTSATDMLLAIAAKGIYSIGGAYYVTTALTNITISAAHASLPRYDIVSIKDSTGTTVATVTAGTAAASPVPLWASVPVTDLIVAVVYVPAADTAITNSQISNLYTISETANTHIASATVEHVIDGMVVYESSTPDEKVSLTAGCYLVNGVVVEYAGGTNVATLTAAHATLDRYDLISISSAGVITATAGTAATAPQIPATPANDVALAAVFVLHIVGGVTLPDIVETDIFDLRHKTNSRLSSKSIEIGDAALGKVRKFSGCKVNSATYTFAKEAEMTAAVEHWGASVDTSGIIQAFTAPSADPYVYFEGRIYKDSTAIALVDTVNLVINNNLERGTPVNDQASPKRTATYIVEKQRRYTTSITLDFDSMTQYELFLGAAAAATPQDELGNFNMTYKFLKSYSDKIEFILSTVNFDGCNIQPGVDALVKQTISPTVKSVKVNCWDSVNAYPTGNPVV